MEIVLTKIIDDGLSEVKETCWLKCETSDDKLVAFWGGFDVPNRNIASIRHQDMPLRIDIHEPENCVPTPHEKKDFGIHLNIHREVPITLDPEH